MKVDGCNIEDSYCIYALMNPRQEIYIGYSADLENRVNQHNKNLGAVATKNRGPWHLFFVEMFEAEADARAGEAHLIRTFGSGVFLKQTYWSRSSLRKQLAIDDCDWDATLANL